MRFAKPIEPLKVNLSSQSWKAAAGCELSGKIKPVVGALHQTNLRLTRRLFNCGRTTGSLIAITVQRRGTP